MEVPVQGRQQATELETRGVQGRLKSTLGYLEITTELVISRTRAKLPDSTLSFKRKAEWALSAQDGTVPCLDADLSKGMGHEAVIVHVNRAGQAMRTEGGGRRRMWGDIWQLRDTGITKMQTHHCDTEVTPPAALTAARAGLQGKTVLPSLCSFKSDFTCTGHSEK